MTTLNINRDRRELLRQIADRKVYRSMGGCDLLQVRAGVRQRLILEVIADYWKQHGIAPTIRDVARTVGCVASTAAYQIGELESVGALTRRPRIPRSMRVAEQNEVTS